MAKVKIGNVFPPDAYLLKRCAPAGFGLGAQGSSNTTSSASDVDTFMRTGWYIYYNKDQVRLIENLANSHACSIYAEMFDWHYGKQTAWTIDGVRLTRSYSVDAWGPWEFENPPMYPWAEYRTTERLGGKPVYAKVILISTLPNSAPVSVPIDAQNIAYAFIDLSQSWIGPTADTTTNRVYSANLAIEAGKVSFTTNGDMTGITARITVKYTKTTD